jgi:hypothetical protein
MTFRSLLLPAGLALAATLPAAAQKPGSIELGGFLAYANTDNSLPVGNGIAFGGRAGVHVLPEISLEVDVARASGNGATHTPIHLWLLYNVPPQGRAEFLIGLGYVRNQYRGTYEANDNGVAALVGVRQPMRDMLAVRVDGHVDVMTNPANKSHQIPVNGNWGLRVGLSVLLNRPSAP